MDATSRRAAFVPDLVQRLCETVSELETLYKGRKFTLDGHLVGSIGEVLAAEQYGLCLLPMSARRHDATTKDGRLVQIKTTQASSIGIRSRPRHLLVVKLSRDGRIEEVYNGPGRAPWNAAGRPQSNGQRQISVAKLRRLMREVSTADQIARLVSG